MSNSTIVLLIYIFFLVPAMLVGFAFARRKLFVPHHKLIMTSITIINWALIFWVMAGTYSNFIAPRVPADLSDTSNVLLPTIHLITGGIAQLLATYLVILMWFEKQLPKPLVIKKIKTPMRITLSLWLITAVLGIVMYLAWNTPASASDDNGTQSPVVTEEAPVSTEEAPEDAESDTPVATEDAPEEPVATEDAPEEPVSTPES